MKVALVHDYIKEYGGAERVLETLHELFPDAPIYTSLYFPEFLGPHQSRFEKLQIYTTWMQHIPFAYKLISPLRLFSPLAFKSLDLSKFDVIIASQTGAYFPNLVTKDNARLITYCHTPPRYLYGYKTARDWKKYKVLAVFAEVANHVLRMVDFKAAQNVDLFVANSQEVAARIRKFYRKEATVIYPPVEIHHLNPQNDTHKKESFYLAGGRLARAKGMDIIVDAFTKNKKPLKIFGKGFAGYGEELRSRAGENIEFVGEVSDEEKIVLMARAKAFVFASFDEDFGITPVEAMGVGTPVIAYKSGGVQETVKDGMTGILYTPNTPDGLNEAVQRFEKMKIDPKDCQTQSKMFSKDKFINEIRALVQ